MDGAVNRSNGVSAGDFSGTGSVRRLGSLFADMGGNSTSETQAATPKAVKAAYDLAAGKAPVSHTHPWSQITDVAVAHTMQVIAEPV